MSEVLRLLDAYVAVAGGSIESPEKGIRVFKPAPSEVAWFGATTRVLALDIESMDLHPDAEVAVIGSRFAQDLLAAARSRGGQLHRGFVETSAGAGAKFPSASLVLTRGQVRDTRTEAEWLPIGRLHLAASVRTGSRVEDRLVQTGWFDLSTGQPIGKVEIDELDCRVRERADAGEHQIASPQPLQHLLPGFLDDVEARLEEWLAGARAEVERSLQRELSRLDGYYGRLIKEAQDGPGGSDAVRAYRQEHERRKAEEIARNRASAELRPMQLELCQVLAERAHTLLLDGSIEATLTSRRLLLGDADWDLLCPSCHGSEPRAWSVCSGGHVACATCTESCTICGGTSCDEHGGGTCRGGDGESVHHVCDDHARRCASCQSTFCVEHAGVCLAGGHRVCLTCLESCASCGQAICYNHTTFTATPTFVPGEGDEAEEPRPLCPACVRLCRDLKDEVRGVDEVEMCQTCGKDVCSRHREVCAVDGERHCLSHLERTDFTRRWVCPEHRGRCEVHTDVLLASDEVEPCTACQKWVCGEHRGSCFADGRTYCREHIVDLGGGEFACAEHHGTCVFDQHPMKLTELEQCPVCGEPACSGHRAECSSCGASVCTRDYGLSSKECRTCSQLMATQDPGDLLIEAFSGLGDRSLGRPVEWEVARDATRRVARVKLSSWGRSVTFAFDHRGEFVTSAIFHGRIFTERLK